MGSTQLHVLLSGFVEVLSETHVPTLEVGLTAILMLIAMKRWAPTFPASLAVVVAGIVTSWGMGFQSIGIDVVGVIPKGLPSFSPPSWSMGDVQSLLPIALTLSLVAIKVAISEAQYIE